MRGREPKKVLCNLLHTFMAKGYHFPPTNNVKAKPCYSYPIDLPTQLTDNRISMDLALDLFDGFV